MKSNLQLLLSDATDRLSITEELSLFRRLVTARGAVARLENLRKRNAQESSQLGIARRQVIMVRNRIATANLPIVVRMSHKYATTRTPQDELVSAGLLVVVKCIDKFDPERGWKFSTYLCRSLFNTFIKAHGHESKHQKGRVDDEENYISESESAETFDNCDEVLDVVQALDENRAELSDVEMAVVRYSYGIGVKGGPRTMHEIHMIVGLTKGRIQQLHSTAMEKLRTVLEETQV